MTDILKAQDLLKQTIVELEGMNAFVLHAQAAGNLVSQALAALNAPDPVVPPVPTVFRISPPITDIPFRITDSFNAPRTYANGKHEGTDFDAYDDAHSKVVNVHAVADGTVLEAVTVFNPPPALNYGIHVIVDHGNGYRSWYCHMSSEVVTVGQVVKRGDVVGVAGKTGTTAIHLHLNIQHIGHGLSGYFIPDAIDPMSIMDRP